MIQTPNPKPESTKTMAKKKLEVTPPDPAEVPALTDRLTEIKATIEELKKEQAEIEAKLKAHAKLQEPEFLADDSREGRAVPLSGVRSHARVVFSSDLMIKSFRDGGPVHAQILGTLAPAATPERSAEDLLKLFFNAPNTWGSRIEDGVAFRAAAAEWLPETVAPQFIAACRQTDAYGIPKSRVSVETGAGALG